jgi:hypothetical protein
MSRIKQKHRIHRLSKPLVIAALISSGTLQLVAPALSAGLDIVNRATATYNDGATTPTTYNATSNTVTLKIDEKAGITIVPGTPSITSAKPSDQLYVDFTITNAGFDPTQFFIPDTATLSNTNFKISGPLTVMSVNGVAQNGTTGVSVPTDGAATGDTTKFTFSGAGAGGSIPVGGTVVVRVPIQVLGSATTADTLTVSLGKTPTLSTPGNAVNNVSLNANLPTAGDVYTVDNPDTVAGEYPGVLPVASNSEAMATSSVITVAARYQAFAAVLKATGGYDPGTTPNLLSDDKLTYNLALKVDNPNPSPSTSLAPSDLYGTAITVDGASANRVLVSDAVPTGTQLGATADIVAPNTSWKIVYTTDPVASKTALAASWSTTRPTTTATTPITRVGFIYNTDATNATPTPGNGPISRGAAGIGTTISGFSFKVNPLASFTGGQIANIAQTFGQSQPGTSAAGTATQIVYDESGDKDTNNALVGADPVAATDAAGGINSGLANPSTDGIDSGSSANTDPTNAGTNIGTNPTTGDIQGGEDTVYTIAATPFTGPNLFPQAAGISPDLDFNKDYTNQSIVLPVGLDPATTLTDAQTPDLVFTNSVKNVSGADQTIALRPSLPATFVTSEAALPIGSTVTINGVVFTLGATGFTTTGAVPTVVVAAGVTASYTVTVNPISGMQTTGYPVVINAFIDGNGDGLVGATEPSNQTTDSYYTGYVKLLKDARILDTNGTTELQGFTTDASLLGTAAQPNRIIQYRIQYQNISVGNELASTGNKSLSANALTILEDGATATNTWFASTNDTKSPTSGGNGSLVAPSGSTVTTPLVPNGTVTNDIQVYTVNVGNVAPSPTFGSVTFDRKIKQ